MRAKKDKVKAEYGDFQTPDDLAGKVVKLIGSLGFEAASILEPTCGLGNLLLPALQRFGGCVPAVGVDINPDYLGRAASRLSNADKARTTLVQADFFATDWDRLLAELAAPVLVLGNPPWVTNADLGTLRSGNLPRKSNFQGLAGLDALTGKSNFDVSEWMLLRLGSVLAKRSGTLAMLCKTAVARKVMMQFWKAELPVDRASVYRIDAHSAFGAAVDACLLVCTMGKTRGNRVCACWDSLDDATAASAFGLEGDDLVADVELYRRWRHLAGPSSHTWRSGIKHDCASVMELRRTPGGYLNGLDEVVDLEDDFVFPMLKSSELQGDEPAVPTRWMVVPQRSVGEETRHIERQAPKTWRYLIEHAALLDRRGSSIYRGKPRFSVFGVGDYSFAPWKVAISGLYKALRFRVVGPVDGRPVVLDDTVNLIPCRDENEAEYIATLLKSEAAQGFFRAFTFWDAKRPVTIDLLRRLSFDKLVRELGSEDALAAYAAEAAAGAAGVARAAEVAERAQQVADLRRLLDVGGGR